MGELQLLDTVGVYMGQGLNQAWAWFNTLTREEWLVVLGATCLCGFLLMRGFGIKKQM